MVLTHGPREGIPASVWNAVGDSEIRRLNCLAMNDFRDGEIFLAFVDENDEAWTCEYLALWMRASVGIIVSNSCARGQCYNESSK